MFKPTGHTILDSLYRRWRRLRLSEAVLLGLAATLPVGSAFLFQFGLGMPAASFLALAAGAAVAAGYSWKFIRPVSRLDLAFSLNRRYPDLEQSADLLLTPEEQLPRLARLQRTRVAERLAQLQVTFPHRLPAIGLLLGAGVLLSWGIRELPPIGRPTGVEISAASAVDSTGLRRSPPPLPPQLQSATVTVRPPAYTALAAASSERMDVEAPAGSTVWWTLRFSSPPAGGSLITGAGEEIPLRPDESGAHAAQWQLDRSGFYFIQFHSPGADTVRTDYYRLIALPDQPPVIRVEGLPPYAEYPFDPDKTVEVIARAEDDFGVAGARLVATVTKGEGESVTFRDDTLYFSTRFNNKAKEYSLRRTIRLADLGMAAGDELYIHLEATDNRTPAPQTTKTAKYIIAFADPEAESADMAGGLAVDRLPEYFRSQRQIIIDTEKLLAEEKDLPQKTFAGRSNDIAVDQKLLRLRYGKFLGEEAVTVIGEGAGKPAEPEDHDHENAEDGHDHDHHHEPAPPGAAEPGAVPELEPYVHAHDNMEEATFFDQATAAKLRAALAEMWQAELHLRLAEPRKALPYEYRALKLIKEIQQASRIYVERTGFSPPLIDVAAKRLTGELNEVAGARLRRTARESDRAARLETAIRILEDQRAQPDKLNPAEYTALQAAGDILAAQALEQPGTYLVRLQQLRQIMDDEAPTDRRPAYLRDLVRTFWNLLPDRQQQPLSGQESRGELLDLYLEELLESVHR